MSESRTTAAELIAMLSELDPDTHVFVDVGWYDWGDSNTIVLDLIAEGDYPTSKVGAVHLRGIEN